MTENGNLTRLWSQLDNRLARIEAAIDRLGNAHEIQEEKVNIRISALELKNAEQKGGVKMLMMLSGATATIGGLVAHLIGKVWQ